ncbi:hypothetical protein ACJMK2_039265 [Sinanodonta woodiana]|uniref:Uncharacterized protein n=1 Tax=Sinanodonta woodiana TaxID=1069815 RepID=A0ABD3WEU9_SINWO
MSLTTQTISDKLKECGHKINRNYPIGNTYNKKHLNIVLETDTPLSTPIQLGKRGPSIKLNPYINKPRFCTNCKYWGHYRSKCKFQSRCNKCGGTHRDECRRKTHKCIHCFGNHTPISPQCPATIRENNIINIMNNENLSYYQAKIKYRTNHTKTKQITQENKPIKVTQSKKGTRIYKELSKLVTEIDKMIDQTDIQNPNLKIELQRSLYHAKTQFFNLITINEPNQNG